MKDAFESLKNNIIQKTTNPFFGTLIIVWIIHNWEFIYRIFNYSSKIDIETRVGYIKLHLDNPQFIYGIGVSIIYAFGALVASYILLNISKFIANINRNIIVPFVYSISDSKKIVSKETLSRLELEYSKMVDSFEKEREAKIKVLKEYQELEIKLNSNNIEIKAPQIKNNKEGNLDYHEVESIVSFIENNDLIGDLKMISSNMLEGKIINLNNNENRTIKLFKNIGLINIDNIEPSENTFDNAGSYYDQNESNRSIEFTKLGEQVLKDVILRNSIA